MAKISKDTEVSIVWTVEREYGFTGPVGDLPDEIRKAILGKSEDDMYQAVEDVSDYLAYNSMVDGADINDESVSLVETEVVTS